MTTSEKKTLLEGPFEKIWNDLWMNDVPQSKKFMNTFYDSKRKYDQLKKGFYMKDSSDYVFFFNLEYILHYCLHQFEETEWEFPKGRRHLNEYDLHCALREFEEETGISREAIQVLHQFKPLEEVFIGMNRVRYRHVYYVAMMKDPETPIVVEPTNFKQICEVKNMKWCGLDEVVSSIRIMYIERKEIIIRIERLLNSRPSYLVT